jgi:hypothetical protein
LGARSRPTEKRAPAAKGSKFTARKSLNLEKLRKCLKSQLKIESSYKPVLDSKNWLKPQRGKINAFQEVLSEKLKSNDHRKAC